MSQQQQRQQQQRQQQEKPWRDEEQLRAVREQCDTQSEMASELGCSVSTVSKWLDKLSDASDTDTDTDTDTDNESLSTSDNHCKFHSVCGNETPGEHNHLCARCLDVLRGFATGVDQDSITGDGSMSLDEFRSIYPNTESETESESIH